MWWRRKREHDLQRELQSPLELETEEGAGDAASARRATGLLLAVAAAAALIPALRASRLDPMMALRHE